MNRLELRTYALFLALALALVGCAESSEPSSNNGNNGGELCEDLDTDGFLGKTADCPDGLDCNDRNPSVNPDADEVCGDGRDNDCSDGDEACSTDCEDADGDNFRDEACGGSDCDDSNADIKPRATEICGNDIDEDCDGEDETCNEGCTDEDGDGFGTEGSTGCEGGDEVDCADDDETVFPGATEVCNEKNDDCDDETDECAGEGQVCAGDRCQGGLGAECNSQDQCAGANLTCDTSTDPGICIGLDGAACGSPDDCVSGVACEDGMCSGSFCANNTCDDAAFPHCNEDAGLCSECPFWESAAIADAACTSPEQCAPGGWCAENWMVDSDAPVGGTTNEAILSASIALADCWLTRKPAGEKDMCWAMWISNSVSAPLTKSMLRDAYDNGDLDGLLGPNPQGSDRDDALNDLWGIGLFNLEEATWNEDLVPGTAKEVCIWYKPGGFLGGESITIDRCDNYSP